MEKNENQGIRLMNLLSLRTIILGAMFLGCLLAGILLGLGGNVIVSSVCGLLTRNELFNKTGTVRKKILQFLLFLSLFEAATFLNLTIVGAFSPALIITSLVKVAIFFTFGWLVNKFGWLIDKFWAWSISYNRIKGALFLRAIGSMLKNIFSKHLIVLVVMFVVSWLISKSLDFLGNMVISFICGLVASYITSDEKRTAFKKILPIFSCLAVLEAATFLCLRKILLEVEFFNSTIIIIGLSISAVLYLAGLIAREAWLSPQRSSLKIEFEESNLEI